MNNSCRVHDGFTFKGAGGGGEAAVKGAASDDPGMAVERECRICCEPSDLVTFHPCQHKIVCSDCCQRYDEKIIRIFTQPITTCILY